METRNTRGSHFAVSLLMFALMALTAMFMLLTAAVVGLSVLTGSIIVSSLIIGGVFAMIALMIYLLVLRDAFEKLHTQIDTIYDVARSARTGYEWVSEKLALWLRLKEIRK